MTHEDGASPADDSDWRVAFERERAERAARPFVDRMADMNLRVRETPAGTTLEHIGGHVVLADIQGDPDEAYKAWINGDAPPFDASNFNMCTEVEPYQSADDPSFPHAARVALAQLAHEATENRLGVFIHEYMEGSVLISKTLLHLNRDLYFDTRNGHLYTFDDIFTAIHEVWKQSPEGRAARLHDDAIMLGLAVQDDRDYQPVSVYNPATGEAVADGDLDALEGELARLVYDAS